MKKLTNLRTAHDVGRTNDHCYTPRYFFDALKIQFDLVAMGQERQDALARFGKTRR